MGSRKEITTPKPSAQLAEFLGIFLGDGGVKNKYQISISYNYKTEQTYANYVQKLILNLFGLEGAFQIRPKEGCGDIIVSSRALIEFLETQEIRPGDKIKTGSHLPKWVFECDETRRASIRGLFDTDGCIYCHTYKVGETVYRYPKLAFTSYSSIIRKQFFDLITLLGFHVKEYANRIHIYSQDETLRYYREVGTQNPVHQARFEEFCEDLELEQFFTIAN